MNDPKEIFLQDIRAYKKGLENSRLDFCNIIANRLNTNAVILNSKEFTFLSLILKDVALILGKIINPELQKDILMKVQKHIEPLERDSSPNSVLKYYFVIYNIFTNALSELEENYKQDKEFTDQTIKYIINFLVHEIEDNRINHKISMVFAGSLNEINRVLRNFGYNEKTLVLQLNLNIFFKVYDYLRFALINDPNGEKSIWNDRMNESINRLKDIIKKYLELDDAKNDAKYLQLSLDFIYIFSKEWREMILRFMEIGIPLETAKQKRNFILPDATKKVLKNIISKGVESEIKDEES